MKINYFKSHHLFKMMSLFIVLFFQNYFAQSNELGTLEGIVLDGVNDLPLPNAVVKLFEIDKYDVSDKNGIFEFKLIPFGNYNVEVSFVGYKTEKTLININKELNKGLIIHLFNLPIETSTIVVTGSHTTTKFDDMNEFINVLKGKELQREIGLTLASTLKNETGLAIRSMGPAPARPVIRGLGSDRIAITEDGIQTTDLSATSPDHAVSVEPFTIERVEVVRGPKVLLKNSTTMGGVVNIIRNEIPIEVPKSFTGNTGFYGETSNSGYLGAFVGQLPLGKFVFRSEVTYRKANDLRTPNDVLKNSDIETNNYSAGVSFIDDWGFTGFSIREFKSDYGVPGGFVGAHPNGVNISMLKRQINGKFNLKIDTESFENIELQLSRDYYKHTEYERADLIGAQFVIYNFRGSLDLSNKKLGLFDFGTSGISFEIRDFNIGGFVFTPPTKSLKVSSYSYQTFEVSDFSFEAAFRFSFDDFNPRFANPSSDPKFVIKRNFLTYSLSFSALYSINKNLSAGINVNKSSRVPTIEELYSEGPHLAAYSYEIGNPNLESENGIGIELFSFYKNENIFLMLTAFRNDFSYFITPRNSGQINSQTLLPIYKTEGVSALFYGLESYFELKFWDNFTISNSLSYTYGEFKESSSPLPQIPPLKNIVQLKFSQDNLSTGISSEIASSQRRVDLFETKTDAYVIFSSYVQYSFETGSLIHNFSLNGDNLFNKEYRNHLSRVKIIMPEAGINFKFSYRLYF
ncbi:MAG: TonB-dependent receptor [Ignavibacteriales bacterium]|nr:TonB-dependent receptor [Ignavibacteriales bacterium]